MLSCRNRRSGVCMQIAANSLFQPAAAQRAPSLARAGAVERTRAEDVDSAAAPRAGAALSDEEQKRLSDLQKRDREVRAHEAAHAAAGAGLAGAPSFSYVTGPDGRRYAIGGEVRIDTSSTGSPEEDIRRAAQIRRAALAPADPSAQDLAVAARATRMEIAARAELSRSDAQTRQAARTAAAYETQAGEKMAPGSLFDLRA